MIGARNSANQMATPEIERKIVNRAPDALVIRRLKRPSVLSLGMAAALLVGRGAVGSNRVLQLPQMPCKKLPSRKSGRGLTPELSGAAKRLPLERIVRPLRTHRNIGLCPVVCRRGQKF
jgi:hypothetical protein